MARPAPKIPLLDRAIGVVSPRRMKLRVRDRAQAMALAAATGQYRGARSNRLTGDWTVSLGSADTDSLFDLDTLRARSRDLMRNNAWAQVLETLADHIVGEGLVPHARVDFEWLGITEDEADAWEREADRVFSWWCEEADVTAAHNFRSMTHLVALNMLVDGEVFGQVVNFPDTTVARRNLFLSTAIELVDPDQVKNPSRQKFDGLRTSSSSVLRHGVECDQWGRPLAYMVQRFHESERGRIARRIFEGEFKTIPASRMLHVFDPRRIKQTRGIPRLASALTTLDKIDRLLEAELVTALVNACHSLWIRTTDPEADIDGLVEDVSKTTASDGTVQEHMDFGMVHRLGPGEDLIEHAPNRPGDSFDPFMAMLLRTLATAIGTTYEAVSRDFRRATFASGRQGAMQAEKFHKRVRTVLVRRFCEPVRRAVLREAILAEKLPLPGRGRELTTDVARALFGASWSGPGFGYIDPQKEVGASADAVDANLTSLARECAARGLDVDEVLRERAREIRRMETLGIPARTASPAPAQTPPPDDDEEAAA